MYQPYKTENEKCYVDNNSEIPDYEKYKQMQKAITNSGIQARMDYEVRIK